LDLTFREKIKVISIENTFWIELGKYSGPYSLRMAGLVLARIVDPGTAQQAVRILSSFIS
jgi:hypothetical protein